MKNIKIPPPQVRGGGIVSIKSPIINKLEYDTSFKVYMENNITPYSVVLMERNTNAMTYGIYKSSYGFQNATWLNINKNSIDPYNGGYGRGTFVPVFETI